MRYEIEVSKNLNAVRPHTYSHNTLASFTNEVMNTTRRQVFVPFSTRMTNRITSITEKMKSLTDGPN